MVKWTPHARRQLRHIHDYIAQDSQHYAKQVTQELVQKSMTLDALPRIGRVVPELNDKTVREVSLYSYRIIYQIQPTHIDILAIIHKRRNLKPGDIAKEAP
ncbi:MAG: type II toxin-antitoxin system RelE/ParE family toxin [Gammaproteobacteria bacterium]